MLPSKQEIQETLQTLGWGDGGNIYFYDLSGKDTTRQVHTILGVAHNETALMEVQDLGQFIKKCRLDGIGWRQIIALWIRARFSK